MWIPWCHPTTSKRTATQTTRTSTCTPLSATPTTERIVRWSNARDRLLAYVAEKTRHAIEAIHAVFWSIGDESGDRASTQAAFHYSVVSYLAPHNMLAQIADHAAIARLLAMSPQDLSRWLDVIAAERSVTG